jgi:diguanylate cyclase (GGDEF)-like protein/PAS domain S-box-containing protein
MSQVPEHEQTLARLLEDLPDAAIAVDGQGRVMWGNRAAEGLFGRTRVESIGMSGLDLIHPEDLEFVLRSLVSVRGKEVGSPIEVRVATASGWRLVELVGTPVPWFEDGAVLMCLRDLTERRRFELAHHHDARLRSLVHNSSSITMLVSPGGTIVSVSGALSRLLGHDPELVEGRPLAQLVSEPDRPTLEAAFECAASGATAANPVTVRLALKHHGNDGSSPYELALVNLVDDPTVGGYVVSGHDITVQMLTEFEVRKALSLLTATLDSTADGIVVVDGSGRIVNCNRRFSEMLRLPNPIPSGPSPGAVTAFFRDKLLMPELFLAKLEELSANREAESCDVLEFVDGRVYECVSRPQRVDGAVVGRVWSLRDTTDRKQLEERLSHQAFHDSLTGLGNRALFQDRLQHAMARTERTHLQLAVLFLDVDNFKVVNDTLGHSAGDALLQATAEVLVGCLRESDTAARLGGDEFGVVLEEIGDRHEVVKLVERILIAARRPFAVGGQVVSTTVSIGITFHRPGVSSDQLLRNADRAMYAAKERGRNRFAEFEDGMSTVSVATL